MHPPFPGDRACGSGRETWADSLALSEEPDYKHIPGYGSGRQRGQALFEMASDSRSDSTQPEASLWLLPPAGRARRSRNGEPEVRPSAATLVTSSLSLAVAIYKMGLGFQL